MSQPNLAAALAAARAELADQVLNAPGDVNRYVRWFESDSTEVCLDGLFNMEAVIKAAVDAAIKPDTKDMT
jgi:hypothetical protein